MVKKEIMILDKKETVDLMAYFYSKKDQNTYLIYNFNNESFCGKTIKEKDVIKVYKLEKKDLENYDDNISDIIKMPFAVIENIKVLSVSKIALFNDASLELVKKSKKEILNDKVSITKKDDIIKKAEKIKEKNKKVKKESPKYLKYVMPIISIAIIVLILYVVLVYVLNAEITFG